MSVSVSSGWPSSSGSSDELSSEFGWYRFSRSSLRSVFVMGTRDEFVSKKLLKEMDSLVDGKRIVQLKNCGKTFGRNSKKFSKCSKMLVYFVQFAEITISPHKQHLRTLYMIKDIVSAYHRTKSR